MRRAWVAFALAGLTCLVPGAAATLRIEGFTTDLSNNEDAILLRNIGSAPISLGNATLEDANAGLTFPGLATVATSGSLFIATNRSAFVEAFGREPDYALDADDESRRMTRQERTFALSNSGDALTIRVDGKVHDAVSYGSMDRTIPGWNGSALDVPGTMFLRWFNRTTATDTDSKADWTPGRRSYVGEDLFTPHESLVAGRFFPYVAPEHSRSVVKSTALSAERSLRINVYQFRDIDLANDIAEHMRTHPGLRVEVILDVTPVGESREELSERGHVIQVLSEAGADVRMFTHARYAYDHAKYMVVDDEILLVQTENFVPSGIPADGMSGNRGWGLVVANRSLAVEAAQVFDADFSAEPFGARPAGEPERPAYPMPALGTAAGSFAPGIVVDQTVPVTLLATPFVAAGADDPITTAIHTSTTSIDVAQLDLAPKWRLPEGELVPHGYLDALIDAAERGVKVRILLDGHFLDDAQSGDNADTVDVLSRDHGRLPIEARLRPASSSVLHAKGMVVDGRTTLVGSMNWNTNSLLQNRELGLLVEEPTIADFFTEWFEQDWEEAGPPGVPSLTVATVLTLAGLAVAFKGTRRR